MKETRILASTGVTQGRDIEIRIGREAIDSAGRRDTVSAIPVKAGHDPTSIPVGKVTKTWTEVLGDQHVLLGEIVFEDDPKRVRHEGSGTELVRLEFRNARMRFVNNDLKEGKARFTVGVDTANFASMDRYEAFYESIADVDESFERRDLGQLALDPEPIVKFVIENPATSLVIVWLLGRMTKMATYAVDETMKKVVDGGLAVLAKKVQIVLDKYRRIGKAKDDVVYVQLVLAGEPKLVLIVKAIPGGRFPELDLEAMRPIVEICKDLVEEDDLQELRMVWGAGRWELLYAKTLSGRVVGSWDCYVRTMERLGENVEGSGAGGAVVGRSRAVEEKESFDCDS